MKGVFYRIENVYDRGITANCEDVCCSSLIESKLSDLSQLITSEEYIKRNIDRRRLSSDSYRSSRTSYSSMGTTVKPTEALTV